MFFLRCLTVVAGQAPAAGHALHATGEVVSGLGHTHRGNTHAHGGGAGQLDERDVIVDGEAVVAGVLEHLEGEETVSPHGKGRLEEQEHLRIQQDRLSLPCQPSGSGCPRQWRSGRVLPRSHGGRSWRGLEAERNVKLLL